MKHKEHNERSLTEHGEQGFTILEILVAMTIFLVVSGSIFGLLRVAQRSRTAVSNNVQLTKSVRMGLNLVGRDTYNAGFGYPLKNAVVLPDNRISARLGIPNDLDTTRDTVPPIIAGNNIAVNTFNTTPGVRTDQVTFLYKDGTFNLVGPAGRQVSTPLQIGAPTSASPTIDQIIPISGSNTGVQVNDLMLVTGGNGARLGVVTGLSGSDKIQFANGDKMNFNLAGSTDSIKGVAIPANIIRVKMVTYFVTTDGILTRREFVNVPPPGDPAVGYVDEPLVYGVDDFQIKYVMDDGTLLDNPSAGPDGIAGNADDDQNHLAAVRQIRFTVSARTTELDAQGVPIRVTQMATFSTRNLGYDAT